MVALTSGEHTAIYIHIILEANVITEENNIFVYLCSTLPLGSSLLETLKVLRILLRTTFGDLTSSPHVFPKNQ